jgi:hypothetical protein
LTPRLIIGELSPRAHRLVVEWAEEHAEELKAAWRKAAAGIQPDRIAPLE